MGYLTLTRRIKDDAMDCNTEGVEWMRLPDSKVSISCLQMQGTCEVCYSLFSNVHGRNEFQMQPFRIEINPPVIIIPGEIPIFNKLRKKFKVCEGHK